MSSREGWSRLRSRSIISVETISIVWFTLRTSTRIFSGSCGFELASYGFSVYSTIPREPHSHRSSDGRIDAYSHVDQNGEGQQSRIERPDLYRPIQNRQS